jgi:hypothetical protein
MVETSTGSPKWRTSNWQGLLRSVLPVLDALPGRPEWSIGGGTALAVTYAHRISYDIDIFLDSASTLKALTPAKNAAVRALVGENKFEFPGNYLKLNLADGEIDFIVAAAVTDDPTTDWVFEGRTLALETPVEIAAKKISYRSSGFKVRDILDLAVVIAQQREALDSALLELREKLPRLFDRVSKLKPFFAEQAAADINPTDLGRQFVERAPDIVLRYLADWAARHDVPLPADYVHPRKARE